MAQVNFWEYITVVGILTSIVKVAMVYCLCYVFWWNRIKPEINALKLQNDLLKTDNEILKGCIEMIQSGKAKDVDNLIDKVTSKITRDNFHKWYGEKIDINKFWFS